MPISKHFLYFLLVLTSGAAMADGGTLVATTTALNASKEAASSTVQFKLWKSRVLVGESIGTINKFENEFTPDINTRLAVILSKIFSSTSTKLGYSLAQDNDSTLHTGKPIQTQTDFIVGASLLNYKLNSTIFDGKMWGSVFIKLKWEVFSQRKQKLVYSRVIENSMEVPSSDPLAPFEFYSAAMRIAVTDILADAAYVNAIEGAGADKESARHFDVIQVRGAPASTNNAGKNPQRPLAGTVTIESTQGSGSGFYIGEDGYILTNAHVVSNAKYVRIQLFDGRRVVGEVLRSDVVRDVALVKADASSAKVFHIASSIPNAGQSVYALGSPFGEKFSGTITHGMLSATQAVEGKTFLQSDAAVNPGNSGGPLIDEQGNAIGITQSMVFGAKGLGFFIPIEEALTALAVNINL